MTSLKETLEGGFEKFLFIMGIHATVLGTITGIFGRIASQYSSSATDACWISAFFLWFSAFYFLFPFIGGPLYERIKNFIIRDSEMRDRNTGAGALYVILTVLTFAATIGGIWGTSMSISVLNHRDTVRVANTEIVQRGFEVDQSYIDPVARLYFATDLEIDAYEVASVYVHFLVYENDQYIGFFKSSFQGNDTRQESNGSATTTSNYFKAQATHRLTFMWQESSVMYTRDETFYCMFTSNLDTITIVPRIVYVSFVDGPQLGDFNDYNYGYYDASGAFHTSFTR
jgi:hypothetical protein